jgi:RNA polymerase sigma-70 factor, ECF subfamily
VDSALHRRVSEGFIGACTGGDLEGLLALLDPAVDGASDIVPGVLVGAAEVAAGIMRYLGPPASLRCCTCPSVIGSASWRCGDRRVLALVLLTIGDGLVVHVDALAGKGPRAAVSAALGVR